MVPGPPPDGPGTVAAVGLYMRPGGPSPPGHAIAGSAGHPWWPPGPSWPFPVLRSCAPADPSVSVVVTATLSASRHRVEVHPHWTAGPPDPVAAGCRTRASGPHGPGRDRHRTLTRTVSTAILATITLDFDPFLRFGDSGVRFETIALAGAVLIALGLAALIAGRTPVHDPHAPAWATAVDLHLRRDDLLFIVLGAIPGAVIGGRIGYVLLHLDFYLANPGAIADPNQGSLELGFAVLLGVATGAYVARLLDAPVGRWFHAAAIPVLAGLALGELARVLGGSGQGLASDAPWATAYAGTGPWESLVPATAAHPTQVYDALAAALALMVVGALIRSGVFRARDGSAFFVGLLIWSLGRSLVTLAWRDDQIVGPLRAGTLIALTVAAAAVLGIVLVRIVVLRGRRQAHADHPPEAGPDVDWPDPEARPRF